MRSGSSGVYDEKSRAYKTSAGSGMRLSRLGFDDDLAEELGLLGADPPEADQLQHGEQGDDDLGALSLAADERREQERPRVAEQRQDLGHPLENRGRVRLDLAGARAELLLAEPADRPLQQVDRDVLERDLVRRRQGARRPAPDKRLLGFPHAEPRAERLHVIVPAEALLQLVPKCLALIVLQPGFVT